MLKKVLKYDLKSVFRFWWIAAVTTLIFSLIGSGCLTILNSERQLPDIVEASAVFALFFVFLSYSALMFVSIILIFLRFYKNFFTDEGYLTFTLPVKCSQLLNSKVIMGVVTTICTYAVCAINVMVMFGIAFAKDIFSREFFESFLEGWKAVIDDLGAYLGVYFLELFIILVLGTAFSCLFLFCCITFASIITKKAKVITAIAIYYVANGILSFVMQIFTFFAMPSFLVWLDAILPIANQMVALAMLVVIIFMAILCMLLYILQYWMMDRKLNLN